MTSTQTNAKNASATNEIVCIIEAGSATASSEPLKTATGLTSILKTYCGNSPITSVSSAKKPIGRIIDISVSLCGF